VSATSPFPVRGDERLFEKIFTENKKEWFFLGSKMLKE